MSRLTEAQNTLAKLVVNHYTKSSLQSPVSSQEAVGVLGGDLDDLMDWRREKGVIEWLIVAKQQKNKKRRGAESCGGGGGLDQDARLVSPSHPSRRGNVMETLEFFQTLSTMATTHRGMPPPSLPADFVNISRDKLLCHTALIWRPEGRNLQWEPDEWKELQCVSARNKVQTVK